MIEDLQSRIRCKELLGRIASAEDAVGAIRSGMSVAMSSDLLPICAALEKRAREEPGFRLDLWSAVPFLAADRVLGRAGAVRRRFGQQTPLRNQINRGLVEYVDAPLGFFCQSLRSGEFGPLDFAIVEAVGITEQGCLIPSYRLNDVPAFVQTARQVVVQINSSYPLEMEGMHDVYVLSGPPGREPIPIRRVDDRIGLPHVPLDRGKIASIVVSETPEPTELDLTVDDASRAIGRNLVAFLRAEVAAGRLPASLLPIEMGLGAVPSAVLDELGDAEFENLEFYSAVLNDRVLRLISKGKVRAASGAGFILTAEGESELIRNLTLYKRHITLRPTEIADCPEVIMRLGLIALNGAVEVDIYGNVNSSHVMAGDVVSGIGGVSEFALNAYLSIILLPSTTRSGDVSCIVPMTTHVDVPEHGVDVLVTEQGVADLRGLEPKRRAEAIIRCGHPEYRPLLEDYFQRARKAGGGHEPHLLGEALSFHQRFLDTGSMKRV